MWCVPNECGELEPLGIVNALAKVKELLRNHDETHRGAKYPFCEDYSCFCIREVEDALSPSIEAKE